MEAIIEIVIGLLVLPFVCGALAAALVRGPR